MNFHENDHCLTDHLFLTRTVFHNLDGTHGKSIYLVLLTIFIIFSVYFLLWPCLARCPLPFSISSLPLMEVVSFLLLVLLRFLLFFFWFFVFFSKFCLFSHLLFTICNHISGMNNYRYIIDTFKNHLSGSLMLPMNNDCGFSILDDLQFFSLSLCLLWLKQPLFSLNLFFRLILLVLHIEDLHKCKHYTCELCPALCSNASF